MSYDDTHLPPCTILLLDENPSSLDPAATLLRQKFPATVAVAHPSEGLARFRARPTSVVLFPAMLAGELVPRFRQEREETLLIALWSPEEPEQLTRAVDAGVDCHLARPWSEESLLATISVIRNRRAKGAAGQEDAGRLRRIGDTIEEGVYVLDPDHKVRYVNQGAVEILGYRKEELLGRNFHALVHFRDKHGKPFPPEQCPIHRVLATGDTFRDDDDLFLAKDGTTVPVAHYSSPLFQDGAIAGTVTVFRDIRREKEAEKAIRKAKSQEEELLRYQNKYHSIQQKLAFQKQLKIMKDQLASTQVGELLVETRYQPLDILSGDTYGTIVLGDGVYLLYLIDAMGKGLSASVTSIQSSSFINHALDKGAHEVNFDPKRLITSFTEYIKKKLLDDEMLCAAFLAIDEIGGHYQYAGFGMPPLLVEHYDGSLEEIRNNNLPIMSFSSGVNLSTHDFHPVKKMVLYSDGLNEGVVDGQTLYQEYLARDFLASATLKQLHRRFLEKAGEPEDDLTMIMVRKIPAGPAVSWKGEAASAEETLESAREWLQETLGSPHLAERLHATLALLVDNGWKHGGGKAVQIVLAHYPEEELLAARVTDGGEGFDAADFFKQLHLGIRQESGRGIVSVFQKVDGLYYNEQGNEATFLLDLRT